MVHVGADVPLGPRQPRQILGLELAGVEREAQDPQAVAWELAADERGEGQRHLLGRQEVAVVDHRPAHIEHDDRRRLRRQLGAEHLEVLGSQPQGCAGAVALDRVHQRFLEVE